MSVVYSQSLKNTRMNDVKTAIDAGSGAANLQIANSSGFGAPTNILVTITLADPASAVVSDVLTFASLPVSASAAFTGTATQARIRDSDGNVVISGLTVGTSATNLVLNTTSIESGQLVRLDSGTITHG